MTSYFRTCRYSLWPLGKSLALQTLGVSDRPAMSEDPTEVVDKVNTHRASDRSRTARRCPCGLHTGCVLSACVPSSRPATLTAVPARRSTYFASTRLSKSWGREPMQSSSR
jgi:hypothetical protein